MKVRRPEYRRKRKYEQRARKRMTIPRMLRLAYTEVRGSLFPLITPFNLSPRQTDDYAGHGLYFEVAAPVNYGDSAGAP